MDLTLDSLYDAADPGNTPCRWSGNIGHCKESELYFISAIVATAFDALNVIVYSILLYRSDIPRENYLRPWKWSTSAIFYIGAFAFAITFILNNLLILINPPMPYWARHTLFDLPYTFLFCGVYPYLRSLVERQAKPIPGGVMEIIHHRFLSFCLVIYCPCAILSNVCIFLRGVFMDLGRMRITDMFTSIGLSLLVLELLICGLICWVCGCHLASLLTARIIDAEWDDDPFAVSTRAPNTIGFSDCRKVTTVEAIAVLQKIRYLNLFFALGSLMAVLLNVTTVVLPTELYRIPWLSYIFFTYLFSFAPLFTLGIACFALRAEYKRRMRTEELTVDDQVLIQALCVRTMVNPTQSTPTLFVSNEGSAHGKGSLAAPRDHRHLRSVI